MKLTHLTAFGAVFCATSVASAEAHIFYSIVENGTVEIWAEVSQPTHGYQIIINSPGAESAFLGGVYDDAWYNLFPGGDVPALHCDETLGCAISIAAACSPFEEGSCEVPPGVYRLATLFFEPTECLDFTPGEWGPFNTEFSYAGVPVDTSWDAGGTSCSELPDPCEYDLNGDGTVDTVDMLWMIGNWGAPYDNADFLGLLGAWGDC